jgi:phosphoglycolate phosphatase-like HAD superfamily hydrolase
MTIQLIVYDLDGTIVDSAEIVLKILNKISKNLLKENLQLENLKQYLSLGGKELIRNSLKINNEQEITLYLNKFREEYYKTKTPKDKLFSGIMETLKILERKNILIALCTNKPRLLVEKTLKDLNLSNKFNYVCAGDDLTTKKPNPENLNICLRNLKVEHSNALMVGDSRVDQLLCKNTNVKFIHFEPGYDDGVIAKDCYLRISKHKQIVSLIK